MAEFFLIALLVMVCIQYGMFIKGTINSSDFESAGEVAFILVIHLAVFGWISFTVLALMEMASNS